MSVRRQAAVAAARAGVGTRFRPQGRSVGVGLDCIGVALLAAEGANCPVDALPSYALSGDHADLLDRTLTAQGCQPVEVARPGDILVFRITAHHRHLALWTGTGIIHAHAGLGRVVEGPCPPDWPLAAIWALPGID